VIERVQKELVRLKPYAQRSTFGRIQMSACVRTRDAEWVVGINQRKTHPKSNTPWHFIHAEFDAVNKARLRGLDLLGAEMFVVRWRRDNAFGMAKPCEVCHELLKSSGFRSVLWTTDTGFDSENF